jgi:hypothetical protein
MITATREKAEEKAIGCCVSEMHSISKKIGYGSENATNLAKYTCLPLLHKKMRTPKHAV